MDHEEKCLRLKKCIFSHINMMIVFFWQNHDPLQDTKDKGIDFYTHSNFTQLLFAGRKRVMHFSALRLHVVADFEMWYYCVVFESERYFQQGIMVSWNFFSVDKITL